MLHIENECKTPIDSNYYQNNAINFNPEKPNDNQNTLSFTPYFFETSSNSNKLYENTTNRIQPPKEKI